MQKKEKFKIDKTDRTILNMLVENSRMSNLEIGKALGISHDAVRYRIEKLVEAGIILNFTVNVNPTELGLPIWGDLIVSVWNLTEKRYKEWVEYLKNNSNIVAVWNLSGKYEWFIEIFTTDLGKFNEITNEIKLKFSDIIKDMESAFVLKELKHYRYPIF